MTVHDGRRLIPELPEIVVFARDMRKELVGRTISRVEVLQPRCLNVLVEGLRAALTGAEIRDVTPRGEWLQVETTQGWLLLSLGKGLSPQPEAHRRNRHCLRPGSLVQACQSPA